ncbi:MAG: holo-[acyl-carrier-protein] synthase [Chloroflexi bacterium RBG_16_48_7]|nr:MAG: holo-[acyl-carrier-protein] synthase [Chloroflexi bacterium RBG_16_48_7]
MSRPYIGVDIIEIGRIGEAVSNWNGHFLDRVYSKTELAQCEKRLPSLAARFAAKEAVIKALGSGFIESGWKDIEILSRQDGSPYIKLHGNVLEKANLLGLRDFSVSLSHCKDYAIAMLVSYAD